MIQLLKLILHIKVSYSKAKSFYVRIKNVIYLYIKIINFKQNLKNGYNLFHIRTDHETWYVKSKYCI